MQYGAVVIADAAQLNCVTPCGSHGNPAPRPTGAGTIGCTCECDAGWATAPNQAFDNFKYCSMDSSPAAAGSSSPIPSAGEARRRTNPGRPCMFPLPPPACPRPSSRR